MFLEPTKLRGVSARIAKQNTAETDAQDYIWCIVTDNHNQEHRIHATDPLDAINVFNQMHKDK